MSILFIADIHLSVEKPKITDSFLNFLNNQAIHAKALYILGDLFETWLGDDNCDFFHFNIANAFKNLTKKNVACYFIHGNRDFLLGQNYANLCGMTILPMKKMLKLSSGKKIVILHGDVLCINDTSYLRFRKFILHITIKKIFLSLPILIRSYIFKKIRIFCVRYNKHKKKNIFHVNLKTIVQILNEYQAEIIIHGHTHQSAIYKILHSEKNSCNRIVLGSWNRNGSVIKINEDTENITLTEFPLN